MAKKQLPTPEVKTAARKKASAKPRPAAKKVIKKQVTGNVVNKGLLPKEEQKPLKPLSPVETAFLDQYMLDPNGGKAYKTVKPNCTDAAARVSAARMLAKANVAAELVKRRAERAERLQIDGDKLVEEANLIALADTRELMERHNYCCRHCWGEGFLYQRTDAEMQADRETFEDEEILREDKALSLGKPFKARTFREQGGTGYDGRKDPNPNCTKCWGRGVGVNLLKDTRHFSKAAVALYGGIKETKDGLEVLKHDKRAALDMMWRHQGLYEVDNAQKNEVKPMSQEEKDALYAASRAHAEEQRAQMVKRRKQFEEEDAKVRAGEA